jgi:hypothetical protein
MRRKSIEMPGIIDSVIQFLASLILDIFQAEAITVDRREYRAGVFERDQEIGSLLSDESRVPASRASHATIRTDMDFAQPVDRGFQTIKTGHGGHVMPAEMDPGH